MCNINVNLVPEDGDYLGRDYYIDQIEDLINTISNNNSGGCIAVNGRWGVGKSFLLNKLERKLLSGNGNASKYSVVRYNCWQYDYYDEPLISLITTMLDFIQDNKLLDLKDLKDKGVLLVYALADIVKNKTGLELRDYFNTEEKGKKEYDPLYSLKKQIDALKNLIAIVSQKSTIVLLVDELDRCLPEYAIKILERLHHIFYDIDGFITIIAVDGNQLENSVKKIYGEKMDYDLYIRKYIDFSIELSVGEIDAQLISAVAEYTDFYISDAIRGYLQNVISKSKIDIRNLKKVFRKIVSINKVLGVKFNSSAVFGVEFTVELMRYLGLRRNNEDGNVKALSGDLSWMSLKNDDLLRDNHIKELLGTELFKYISDSKKHIKTSTEYVGVGIPVGAVSIKEDDLAMVFWIISQIYGNKTAYYFPNKEKHEEDLLTCQKYCMFSKVIQ